MRAEILDLNPEQKKAFNRLKKAYEDCKKLKIFFVNNYGSLEAYDKKYVKDYSDSVPYDSSGRREDEICLRTNDYGNSALNRFNIASEWCDDNHFIHLTEAGIKKNMGD